MKKTRSLVVAIVLALSTFAVAPASANCRSDYDAAMADCAEINNGLVRSICRLKAAVDFANCVAAQMVDPPQS